MFFKGIIYIDFIRSEKYDGCSFLIYTCNICKESFIKQTISLVAPVLKYMLCIETTKPLFQMFDWRQIKEEDALSWSQRAMYPEKCYQRIDLGCLLIKHSSPALYWLK